jgi:thymidylate synthase
VSTLGTFASLDDAYSWIINAILRHGERVSPRAIPTTELRAVSISIANPRRRYISLRPRRWSFGYALGEFCWHARGSDRLDEISFYSERWREMSDDGHTISGSCYGAKIFQERGSSESQWILVKRTLDSDPASRRAILAFSDRTNMDALRSRDINCATTLQFFVRAGKLEAIASMRSNDVILGLPYDIFLFTMLQEMMAVELRLEVGSYHHFVGSLHIYDSNLSWAQEMLAAVPTIDEPMPIMTTLQGIEELLEGERQTREPDVLKLPRQTTGSYWEGLLRVLHYYNGSRLGKTIDEDSVLDPPLYGRLAALRRESPSRFLLFN